MERIHSLPELCLLTIFDRIPLDDLTRIGRVCQRWYSLEKSAFARRHHLSLFVCSKNQEPESNPERIHLKCFKNSTTQKVIDLFPNVNSLTIEHEDADDDDYDDDDDDIEGSLKPISLTNLLTHQWSSKLISFKLIKTYGIFYESSKSLPIIEAINNLSSLTRLSLLNSFCYDGFKPQFRIIAQLEEFYFQTPDDIEPYDWLSKFSEGNSALRRIELDIYLYSDEQLETLLKFTPQLAAKFTSLYSSQGHFIEVDNSLLARFCLHFSSLRRININQPSDDCTLTECLACLAPLKQLVTLGLNFYFLYKSIEEMSEIEPLDSVTKLTLDIKDHPVRIVKFMNSFNFGYLFPKLEFVVMDFKFDDDDKKISNEQTRTYKSMIEPLKRCENLKQIQYKNEDFEAKLTRNGEM